MIQPRTPGKARTLPKTPRKQTFQNGPREPVQVFGRLRPLRSSEDGPCVRVVGKTDMVLTPPECSIQFQSGRRAPIQHTFHEAFGAQSTQKEVFDSLGLPLVTDLLNSKNGLLFAYGITGSGKTHTMTGEPHDPGILPRCLDVIFNSIQHLQAKKYTFMSTGKNNFEINTEAQAERERRRQQPIRVGTRRRNEEASAADTVRIPESFVINDIDPDSVYGVVVSFVEIFNDYVFDLLEDVKHEKDMRDRGPQSKKMREDTTRHQMYVNDVTEVPVTSTEEAYEQLLKGQKKRRVAHTQLNHESSRSHSIFNIRLIRAPLDEAGKSVLLNSDYLVVSQLSLVDLAGSERAVRTQNMGERLREAGNINQSLMVLRTCLECLRDNQNKAIEQQKIVPYRDSKITQLFKNFFEGDGKVRMIICCSAANSDFDEMLHVMKFAEVSQQVMVARSQAVKFDIPGLAPGRRHINEAIEAMADGTSQEHHNLPFRLDVVEVPESPHSSFSPFVRDLEQQSKEFESGRHFIQRGLDMFKTGLFRVVTSHDEELRKCHEDMADLHAQLLAQEEAQAHRTELETNVHRLRGELEASRSRYATEVHSRTERASTQDREIKNLRQQVDFLQDENNTLARSNEESEQMNQQLLSDVHERDEKLSILQQIVQKGTPVKSPPMSPDVDKENTGGRNQAPLRGRKRRSPEKWLQHKPEGTMDTDTVLQPKVKKSKVVTVAKKSDLAKKEFDRYMLHHQEEDSIGELKEQLFKGDVLKTRTGGMSVQFTDIETLQQRRPEDLRRSSALSPVTNTDVDCAENRADVQSRCAAAFEGRPGMLSPSVSHRVPSGK